MHRFISKKKLVNILAKDLANKQKMADYYYYIKKDKDMSSWVLDGIHNTRSIYTDLGISQEVYQEAYKIYDFSDSGKEDFVPDFESLKDFVFR